MSSLAARSARRPAGRTSAAARTAGRVRATATGPAGVALPRRVSGPVRGRDRAVAQPRIPLGERALAVVRSLPDHALIDRLVRGRAWIPVLGVLLAGLVAMQVEILKLGTSIGRSIERTTALQSRNESLQAEVATLADDQRIERFAAGIGMAMPSPTTVAFTSAGGQNAVSRAMGNIHAPDPANFASQLAADIAAAATITPGSTGTPGSNGTPGSTGTSGSTGTPTTAGAGGTPTLGPTATPGIGTTAGPSSTSGGTTSQSTAAAGATTPTSSDTGQAAPTPSVGGSTTASPGVTASATGSGAAALAPSTTQSGSPSGG